MVVKRKNDSAVPIPEALRKKLKEQFENISNLHAKDLEAGYDGVFLPGSLDENIKMLQMSSPGNGFSHRKK